MTDDDFRGLIADLRRKLEKIETSNKPEFEVVLTDEEFRKFLTGLLKKLEPHFRHDG